MGKVFGILVFLVLAVLIALSYSKFVVTLNLRKFSNNLKNKVVPDPMIPDLTYKSCSPYETPVEDHHISCHWHD